MSPEQVFLIEKSMGLFWVLIQQICFGGSKYVYESLVRPEQGTRTYLLQQGCIFGILCVLAFERELGVPFLSSILNRPHGDFYPWGIRIMLCGVMILFDSLLVLYIYRICRLYRHGLASVRPTGIADWGLVAVVATFCVLYVWHSIETSAAFRIPMWDYPWIGRAFIQISNFFYVPLESLAALLLYLFWCDLKKDLEAKSGV